MATIPYRLLPGDPTPKPLLRVTLPGRPPVIVAALVDSGADRSAIPLGLARAVGIPYDPAKPIQSRGAGGTFDQFEATAEVLLESEIGPIRLDRPTLNDHIPFILLGRDDFFRAYVVRFDQRAMTMEFQPYVPSPRKSKRTRKHK